MKPTRLRGLSDAYGSWKTIIISRRTGRISARESCVMSRPSKTIVPPVGSSSRMMQRAIVDLPQPDSPTTPSVSPCADREADAVDRLHGADLLLEDDPARDGEVLLQILDDEQLVATQPFAPARAGLRPGRRCSTAASGHACSWPLQISRRVSSSRWQRKRWSARVERGERRQLLPADVHHELAARVEAAAARRVEQRRRLAGDLLEPLRRRR